jgi:hypothetical protein
MFKMVYNLAKKFLNILWLLHRPIVLKNLNLKDSNSGETCLIFGNGGSLKYFDFSVLPGLKAICTAYSLADKRMEKVNVKYMVSPDSYNKSPFEINNGKLTKNYRLPIHKKMAIANPSISLVHSLTNFYFSFPKMKNTIYFHHFGKINNVSNDLAGNFSTCQGSLDIMLGLAKYLGFSKAILLGCDYLGSPTLEGHFYSDSIPFYGTDKTQYVTRIKKVAGELDVVVILKKGSLCPEFESATFEEYFGVPEYYQSNTEFIDEEYLTMMRKGSQYKQIYM